MLISSIIVFSFASFIIQIIALLVTLILAKKTLKISLSKYFLIYIVALISVYFIYFGNIMKYGNSYYLGGSDDLFFENTSLLIYNTGIYKIKDLIGPIIETWDNSAFFHVFLARIRQFTEMIDGYHTLIPRVINVFLLIWTLIIIEFLFKKYTNVKSKVITTGIIYFGVNLSILFIYSHVFRDPLNFFQIILASFLFIEILSNKKLLVKIFYIPVFVYLIYAMELTREFSSLFAVVISLFFITSKYKKKFINLGFIFFFIIMIATANIFNPFGINDYLIRYTHYNLSQASDGLSRNIFLMPIFPFGLFIRSFYAMISPFPSFEGLFTVSESFVLDIYAVFRNFFTFISIIFIPFFMISIIRLKSTSVFALILIFIVVTTTFTFRHHIFNYLLFVIASYEGYKDISYPIRKKMLIVSIITVLLFYSIYLLL
jgi:hypothetical protein